MNLGDVVPKLDVDRVQANDELRQTGANFRLVFRCQLGFGQNFVNLRPTPIPHFGLDAFAKGYFDLEKVPAEAV